MSDSLEAQDKITKEAEKILEKLVPRNLSMKMRHVFQLINEFYAAFFASLAFSGGLIQTA